MSGSVLLGWSGRGLPSLYSLPSCRSTPCTVKRVPAFRRPSKNLLLVSSPTLPFELLPPVQLRGLLKTPSGPRDPYCTQWDALALPPVETKIAPIPGVSGIQGVITTWWLL